MGSIRSFSSALCATGKQFWGILNLKKLCWVFEEEEEEARDLEIVNSVRPTLSRDHLHYWSQSRPWTTKCCRALPPSESRQRSLGLESRIAVFFKPFSWSPSQASRFDLAPPKQVTTRPPLKMCIPYPAELSDLKHIQACWMICKIQIFNIIVQHLTK